MRNVHCRNALRSARRLPAARRRRRRLRLDAAPADGPPSHRFLQRAEQHHVHHLAVVEALEDQRREQRPIFVFFERERDDAGEQVDQHEDGEEDQRALDVLRRPELRQAREAKLREAPQRQRQQEQQVDHRRNQRQNNLEQENIGNGDPAERAVARLSGRVAMLPDGLQRAERPAESLANQRVHGLGDFGAADGVFVVQNLPAVATNGQRQIGVFGNRVARKSAVAAQQIRAPRAHRAGHHGNAIQQIERALFEVLAGDVFERLPARDPAIAVDHLHVAGDGADAGIGEMPDQARNRVGIDDRIGVDRDDDFADGFAQPVIQRRRVCRDWIAGAGGRADRARSSCEQVRRCGPPSRRPPRELPACG